MKRAPKRSHDGRIRSHAEACEYRSSCNAEKEQKGKELDLVTFKRDRVQARLKELHRNIEDLRRRFDDAREELQERTSQLVTCDARVIDIELELDKCVRNCQGADSLLREFNVNGGNLKDEEDVDAYETGRKPKKLAKVKDGSETSTSGESNGNAQVTDQHIYAAKQLGVLMLEYNGYKTPIGNKCRALELDLQAFHRARSDKTYYTMKSNERAIDVYRLLHRVLLSGGFKKVCSDKQWNQLCNEAGVISGSTKHCKKWYAVYVRSYEESLLDAAIAACRESDA